MSSPSPLPTVKWSAILRAAELSLITLPGELVGYLVLSLADRLARAPVCLNLDEVELDEAGSVVVTSTKPGDPAEVERLVRELLQRLLAASGPQPAALRRVGQTDETHGLPVLVRELTTALVPINRAAAERAMARLFRQVKSQLADPRLSEPGVALRRSEPSRLPVQAVASDKLKEPRCAEASVAGQIQSIPRVSDFDRVALPASAPPVLTPQIPDLVPPAVTLNPAGSEILGQRGARLFEPESLEILCDDDDEGRIEIVELEADEVVELEADEMRDEMLDEVLDEHARFGGTWPGLGDALRTEESAERPDESAVAYGAPAVEDELTAVDSRVASLEESPRPRPNPERSRSVEELARGFVSSVSPKSEDLCRSLRHLAGLDQTPLVAIATTETPPPAVTNDDVPPSERSSTRSSRAIKLSSLAVAGLLGLSLFEWSDRVPRESAAASPLERLCRPNIVIERIPPGATVRYREIGALETRLAKVVAGRAKLEGLGCSRPIEILISPGEGAPTRRLPLTAASVALSEVKGPLLLVADQLL